MPNATDGNSLMDSFNDDWQARDSDSAEWND